MYIAELLYPGTWLDIEDRDVAFEIEGMLRHLEDLVTEAAVTLALYRQAACALGSPKDDWDRDAAIRGQVEQELRQEAGNQYYKDFDKYRLESERRQRLRKAELGIIPRAYLHKLPFIHAHSFVYAVDSFGKFLDEIAKYDVAPQEVRALSDEFDKRLPVVRKIRNSALHIEDRSRRYASWKDKQRGKRMEVEGFLGLSNLEGDCLCYTIDDGTYQRVSISVDTLSVLVDIANRAISGFSWTGPPRIAPHY